MEQSTILDELKKLNTRMDKLEELHRLVHDLLIEYITIKTVNVPKILNINSEEAMIDKVEKVDKVDKVDKVEKVEKKENNIIVKKTALKKKNILNVEDIIFKTDHEEIENNYYLEFNTKNYVCIEDKLSDNSANNKVNVYKFLFVHFNDMRNNIINKLDCSEFLNNLYSNQKKFKDLAEMLKFECIEIHKQYKDKEIFKKMLIDLKKEYDNILVKVA